MSAPSTASDAPGSSSERDLLARSRSGDRAAQATLYEQYIHGSPQIRGLLRRAVHDESQREDLLQEIYLAVVGSSGEFRGESRLSTYLFRVAQLTIMEAHRSANTQKRGGHVRLVGDAEWAEHPADEPQSTALEYEEVEVRLALARVMDRVPEAYREALRLRLEEELDYQEIAARLGIPMNTVATRIFKGKAVLIEQLRRAGFRIAAS
jgi:RNA polymerase sigma-70 factor, ECF subfamily